MNPHPPGSSCRLAATLIAAGILSIAPVSWGATITWNAPGNITADTDVSTSGALVAAFNLGAVGVPSTVVNGVNFVGQAVTGSPTNFGNFSLAGPTLSGNNSLFFPGPFGLSASYQTLISSAAVGFGVPFTLTMNALIVGATYQFQWWCNDNGGVHSTTASAGNSVVLNSTQGPYGPGIQYLPGQFAIGTFVADATGTQVITFNSAEFSELNGFQLRQLSGVPDHAHTLALLGLAVFGLAALRGFTRRACRG